MPGSSLPKACGSKGDSRVGGSMDSRATRRTWQCLVVISCCFISREYFLYMTSSTLQPHHVTSVKESVSRIAQTVRNPRNASQGSKWIVLDGVASSCHDVSMYTRQAGWITVVVLKESRHIQGCRWPACIQLTWQVVRQEMGHLATSRMLNEPSRATAYLLAISRGARVILDAECETPVPNISQSLHLVDSTPPGLWYNSTPIFDPRQHFGHTNDWSTQQHRLSHPVPHEALLGASNSQMYYVKDLKKISIRQSVIAPHIRCAGGNHSTLSMHVKAANGLSQPPVVAGLQTFSPLSTGPTLFHEDAFWWMLLPPNLSTTNSFILRSLWVHVARALFPVNLAFYEVLNGANSTRCSSAENRTEELYNGALTCVRDVTCDDEMPPIPCNIHLFQGVLDCLLTHSSIHIASTETHLSFLLAWIDDLTRLKISNPKLRKRLLMPPDVSFKIKYSMPNQSIDEFPPGLVRHLNDGVFSYMRSMCPKETLIEPKSLTDWKNPIIDDVMLIIVLNYESLFHTLPYLEYMHRQAFRYIMYCGPSVNKFAKYASTIGVDYVTYIAGLSNGWRYMYECVSHAMKMRAPVRGYLQMGDDILLNTWNFVDLPRHQMWMPKGYSKRDLYKTKFVDGWTHWNTSEGQEATINVFSELHNLTSSTSQHDKGMQDFARRFLDNYAWNIDTNFVLHRAMDIFYIPDVLREDYIRASDLFHRHRSLIEMALPVMHYGLDRKENVVYIQGESLWRDNRIQPWTFFAADEKHFIHPFKSLSHLKTTGGRDFFCKTFLTHYERSLSKIKATRVR